MIEINEYDFRNLEEQVLKNKEDIAKHYQATNLPLNLAGIEVIGEITDPEQLEDKVGTVFGQAYVQVVDRDTTLWIWSRANPDAGYNQPYWLDVPFTTEGPKGDRGLTGERGPQGIRGSQWFSGLGQPQTISGYNVGDYYINVQTGNIWHLHNLDGSIEWVLEGNIKGPEGPQGPRGEKGEQGPEGPIGEMGPQGERGALFSSLGYVSSVDQLPDPSVLDDLNVAYVVGSVPPYTMYVQIGVSPLTATWKSLGPINTGTQVYDSETQTYYTSWDTNTKVDKMVNNEQRTYAYVNNGGDEEKIRVTTGATSNAIAQRLASGHLQVPEDPTSSNYATSKIYVDNKTNSKIDKPSNTASLDRVPIIQKNSSNIDYIAVSNGVAADIVVKRDSTSNITLPGKDAIVNANSAASVEKVLDMIQNNVKITSNTIPAGQSWPELITRNDNGSFLIKGNSTLRYWLSGQYRTVTATLHLIFIAPESNFKRIVHFYTSGLLSGYNELDGELQSDIEISNNQSAGGIRVISTKMPQ